MALELESMAKTVGVHPEVNHHFAERLMLLSKQLREDLIHMKEPG